MPQLRVFYYAEGRGSHGVASTTNGGKHAQFIIDADRWHRADQQEKEAIMLNAARQAFPEINWEKAHTIEIRRTDYER